MMSIPERIASEALRILNDPALRKEMTESMVEVRKSLGEPGAAKRAALIVHSLIHQGEASSQKG